MSGPKRKRRKTEQSFLIKYRGGVLRDDSASRKPEVKFHKPPVFACRKQISRAAGNCVNTPAPGAFDGDGKADLTLFRPSAGDWHFWPSRTNTQKSIHFGMTGDLPVSALATLSQ
jgi:hypothetical protein